MEASSGKTRQVRDTLHVVRTAVVPPSSSPSSPLLLCHKERWWRWRPHSSERTVLYVKRPPSVGGGTAFPPARRGRKEDRGDENVCRRPNFSRSEGETFISPPAGRKGLLCPRGNERRPYIPKRCEEKGKRPLFERGDKEREGIEGGRWGSSSSSSLLCVSAITYFDRIAPTTAPICTGWSGREVVRSHYCRFGSIPE